MSACVSYYIRGIPVDIASIVEEVCVSVFVAEMFSLVSVSCAKLVIYLFTPGSIYLFIALALQA
jgi:uncharacterized membrane protein